MRAPLRLQHLLIPLSVAGLLVLIGALDVLRPVQQVVYDGLLRLRRPAAAQPGILLLDVDDEAVALAGSWPWSRSVLADGLVTLREMDARSALIELPLARPSAPGLDPAALRQELPSALAREFTQIEENVQSLFDAIRRGAVQPKDSARYVADLVGLVAMAKVRLSNAATGIERDDDALLGQAAGFFGRAFVPLDVSAVPAQDSGGEDLQRFAIRAAAVPHDSSLPVPSLLPPVLPVLRGSFGGGFIGIMPGDDPVRRTVPVVVRVGDRHYGQIALAALLDLLGDPGVELRAREIVLHNAVLPGRPSEDITIPLADGGAVLLDWPRATSGDGFRHLSWAQLIRYRNSETDLVADLRDMDAHGWLSYLRSDTTLLDAYERAARLQRDMLAAGTASYVEEWRNARELFVSLCDQYLGGDAETRILADADRAAGSPALSEEERRTILAERLKVPGAFDAARASFSAFRQGRDLLRQTLPSSFAIAAQAGTVDAASSGRTPFGAVASAGAVSAALANTILEGRFIAPASPLYAPLAAGVLSLLLGVVLYRRRAQELVVAGAGLAVVAGAVLGSMFVFSGVYVDPLVPVVSCAATGIALALSAHGAQRMRGHSLRVALAGRLSGESLARLFAAPALLGCEGRRRELAVVSAGLRGLAGAALPNDVGAAAHVLRAYNAGLSEAILTQNGMIAGVSGDAVTACFGALDDAADAVPRACRASLRMKAIERELSGAATASLAVRIGIDAGPCVVGDLGARDAARWSAAGSPTDLASRLQWLNLRYGTSILVSAAVRESAAAAFLLRPLDTMRIAGTEAVVQVFELFADRAAVDTGAAELLGLFEEGRQRYERRDVLPALALFERVLGLRPSDGPAALYAERCRQLIEDPDRPVTSSAW